MAVTESFNRAGCSARLIAIHCPRPASALSATSLAMVLLGCSSPGKYFQPFFDMEFRPLAGGKTSQKPPASSRLGVRIREAAEGKTQMFWAGIEPWT